MMRRRIPSLSALRSFEAVARTLSFTKAACELGVTQAAVSRQVKALETELSVGLVHRGPGGNTLTDAGEILFAGMYRALESIGQSVERITGSRGREILNVSVAPFFSERWLTPRLMDFVRRHPNIDLRLHHSYVPADYRREGIDIGINWGSGLWPGATKEKVLDGAMTPVVSPALFKRTGRLASPKRLFGLTLFYEFDVDDWRLWFAAAGLTMPAETRSLRLSDSHALRRAALDGHGVALLFRGLIQADLSSGHLVQPFATVTHTGYDYYLNYAEDAELPAKSKAFRRWLFDEIARRPFA